MKSPRPLVARSVPVALVLVALISASCRGGTAPSAERAQAPERARVRVVTIAAEPHRRTVDVVGSLHPREQVDVSSQVPGPVAKVAVDVGDTVEAGAVLVLIDPRDYELAVGVAQSQLAQAEAERDQAESNRRRAHQLFPQEAISKERLDAVEARFRVADANVAVARNQLDLAREHLADATVRAPFRARVQRRHVSLGQFVSAGSPLVSLLASDRVKFRGEVPAKDGPRLHVGQPVELSLAGASMPPVTAAVTRIAAGFEPSTRSLPFEVEIPNEDGALIPGGFAQARLLLEEAPALLVPRSALFHLAGVSRVYVVSARTVRSTVVEPGEPAGERVEVLAGLSPGDRVVVSGVDRLADGAEVDVIETPE